MVFFILTEKIRLTFEHFIAFTAWLVWLETDNILKEKLIEKENLLSMNVEGEKIVIYPSNMSLQNQLNIFKNEKLSNCFAFKILFYKL